nr:MFS transporter [Sinorhizobium medicae]MBO1965483.1 MHS family MFS transporter [Sinorhizobium medicae]
MSNVKPAGSPAKVALASFIGTSVEYYDFFIYGTAAALVFPRIFFPEASPLMGTLLAFATFGVGFFARPVGGVVFGHFGDRVGRKKMLVISLVGMGLSTVLMGLLPSYGTIGILAPILLTLLRLIQGFCVGGEWGGAVLMAVEHAPKGKKGFFGAFPQMGAPAGTGLATFAFMLVAGMPDEQFYSWGWRLPFLISALLVLVGLIIRMKVDESPAFEELRKQNQAVKIPAIEAIRTHPREILLVAGIYLSQGVFAYISMSYFVAYGTSVVGIPRGAALQAVLVAAVIATILYPLFGALSDRIGRKTTYMIGAAAMAASIGPGAAAHQYRRTTLLHGSARTCVRSRDVSGWRRYRVAVLHDLQPAGALFRRIYWVHSLPDRGIGFRPFDCERPLRSLPVHTPALRLYARDVADLDHCADTRSRSLGP